MGRYNGRRVHTEGSSLALRLPRCHDSRGKIIFPTPEAAAAELLSCKLRKMFHGERQRNEREYYKCARCHGWHLTTWENNRPPRPIGEQYMNKDKDSKKSTTRQQPANRGSQPAPRPGVKGTSHFDGYAPGYEAPVHFSDNTNSNDGSAQSGGSTDGGSTGGGGE